MKRILYFIVIAVIAISCQKEGPIGPEGPTGPKGDNGTNGKDASLTCQQCHDKTTKIYAAQLQYATSKHGSGENAGYGNRADCSGCHNNEGFNELMTLGTASVASNPTPIGCYTCHFVHQNYDSTDLALKTTAPVVLTADNSITLNLGKSNLCVTCHQSREHGVTGLTASATDSITITSSRFGPHHGPQGNLFAGAGKSGAFEITGSATYSNSMHTTLVGNACIGCHMGSSASGVSAGGHSMNIYYDSHGVETLNSNACIACHADAKVLATKMTTTQAAITTLLTSIETAIVSKGWYDETTGLFKASSTKPLKLTAKQAKALYNFKFIQEDLSLGVHNYNYAVALLTNTLEAVQ